MRSLIRLIPSRSWFRFRRAEIEKWWPVIKAANIKLE
jgi:hypothetical protein